MGNDHFTVWKQEADTELRLRWAIGLNDAGISDEELRKHFQDGVHALDFVEWFARKYDLTDFSEFSAG
ncbi:MAG: hypothetical protein ACM3YN_01505 [Parcubacteria group bacterium]